MITDIVSTTIFLVIIALTIIVHRTQSRLLERNTVFCHDPGTYNGIYFK